MPIVDILSSIKDDRVLNGDCEFNGLLSEYLSSNTYIIDEFKEQLQQISELYPKISICVKLRMEIDENVIANQIIRYRDAFKLSYGAFKCPYLLYQEDKGLQRAMIVTIGGKEEYLFSKGLYYVMSEPDNRFEGSRNEIIAVNFDSTKPDLFLEVMKRYFEKAEKAGVVQRFLDQSLFKSTDEIYSYAREVGQHKVDTIDKILQVSPNLELDINKLVVNWFLLKKLCYVQYMMDKRTLNNVHEGDMKKHRQMAKMNSESIPYVPLYELWEIAKDY